MFPLLCFLGLCSVAEEEEEEENECVRLRFWTLFGPLEIVRERKEND